MKCTLYLSGLLLGFALFASPAHAERGIVAGQLLAKDLQLESAPKVPHHSLHVVRPLFGGWQLVELRDTAGKLASEDATRIMAGRLSEALGADAVSFNHHYRLSLAPDDDDLSDQWAMTTLGMETVWDTTVGLAEQRVGVIDSGIRRDHRELRDKDVAGFDFITNPEQALDNDARDDNYTDSFRRETCDGERVDGQYHGTAVAGAILAASDNSNRIAGLNWNAGLVSARVAGLCDLAIATDVLDAAAWMAGLDVSAVPALAVEDRPQVVNLSFGREGACSPVESDLFAVMADRGVLVVAPTGNAGTDVEAPANCNNVLAVAAHGPGTNKALASYSSVSGAVDLVAPGGDLSNDEEDGILSLSGQGTNTVAWRQGTSLAAAYVSGVASLLWAARPELSLNQVTQTLIQSGSSCTDCPAPALDAAAALNAAIMLPEVAPPGAACDVLACDEGYICAGSSGTTPLCRLGCDLGTGAGCENASDHCLQIQGSFGGGACYESGPIAVGGPCNDSSECTSGHLCRLDDASGVNVCVPSCHHGYSCPSGLECMDLNDHQKYCAEPPVPVMPPTMTPTVTEPPPVEEPTCSIAQGTFGCPAGLGCLSDGNDDDVGFCHPWTGTMEGGSLCNDRYTCASGLCEAGVCLMACEADQCPAGFGCEARGEYKVCAPSGCSQQSCGDGWSCEEVKDGVRSCARSAGGCSARHRVAGASSTPTWSLLAFGGLFGLLRLRRRRS